MNDFLIDGSSINFYEEINKPLDPDIIESCLITKEQLTTDYVTLECGHKFNYLPLYYNCIQYARRKSQQKLHALYKINCPYCRSSQTQLLPHLPKYNIQHVNGITRPENYSYDDAEIICKEVLKYGIRKGCQCKSLSYIDSLCKKHYNLKQKKILSETKKNII